MKKIKSILIIMLVILLPVIVFASSGKSGGANLSVGMAIRNGSICYIAYDIFCAKAFIIYNFKR